MRKRRIHSLVGALLPVCALWVALGVGGVRAKAAEAKSDHPEKSGVSDIVEIVDEMTGHVPTGQEAPSEAVNYQNPPLMPEIPLFLFSLILFAGFVLVMRSAVWNPLISGLDSREERIVQAEAEAREARVEVQRLTDQAEKRLAEVYSEVKSIVAQARAEAEAKKLEIVTQAESDSQRIKQEALADIAQARMASIRELEAVVDQQASLATEQIVGRRL